jgi:peptidoglycan/xylan/chitin deacetylase (PgdA/CDA1 family)
MDRPLPLRRSARALARLLGVPVAAAVLLLLRLSGRRAGVALVYHALGSRTGDPAMELVAPHGERLFERQVRYLSRAFRLVDAAELADAVAHRPRGGRFPAAVTFDDDLASHARVALPILRRNGVRATFFLTGATLDGPRPFWWQRLERTAAADPQQLERLLASLGVADVHELGRIVERLDPEARAEFEAQLPEPAEPGLRAEDVRKLVETGMTIGFHTRRHHFLPLLEDEQLTLAFQVGREELEDAAGRLTLVAYPHGAADQRVAAAARAAGFTIGFTGEQRAIRVGDDPLLLGRFAPSHRSVGQLALQLVSALLRARG